MALPRGIRNNNPLNIRRTGTTWRGQAPGGDDAFVTFSEPEYGIRAAAIVLQNYQEKHGINTLNKIVHRWAPPVENDTSAYLHSVAIWADIEPDETLDLGDYDTVYRLLRAMARMENGKPPNDAEFWIEPEIWEKGLRMAGLVPSKSLKDSRTIQGSVAAAAGAGTAIGVLTDTFGIPPEVAGLLPDAIAGLSDQASAIVFLVISIGGALYAAWARQDDKLKGRL